MSGFQRLKERIQSQVGAGHLVEEDYSFLQPGGNDHLAQFLFNLIPDAYNELDLWDRNNFLLMDLLSEQGLELILDDNGEFAYLTQPADQKGRSIQLILDFRDTILTIAYYFGDSKSCLQLNQKICQCSRFSASFIDTDILRGLIPGFEKTTMTSFEFEQNRSMFLSPSVVKGKIKGDQTRDLITLAIQEGGDLYNIDSVGGFLSDGARGEVIADSNGYVLASSCRLGEFLGFAEKTFSLLKDKYHQIASHYLTNLVDVSNGAYLKGHGGAVEFDFPITVEKTDGLINFFLKGTRDAQFVGTAERLSRKLWRVKVTDCHTGVPVDVEVSSTFVRIYISSVAGIPLLDTIEKYIRRHVSARIDRLVY